MNADLYERAHLQHIANVQERSEAARAWAEARRAALIAARTPFASETVFSHPSKLALIEDAQRHSFTVALHIVALDDPARLLGRVAQRVREGGSRLVAIRTAAATTALVDAMPGWVQRMLGTTGAEQAAD